MAIDSLLEVQVGILLKARGWTIGTAESCTGGLVAHRLTNIAGSSDYVLGGIVAYSNAVKMALLGVNEATLEAHGAVSEAVAAEMATGARNALHVDVAVSITGIAGPGGGTPQKPVGLTYIGLAGPKDVLTVRRHMWSGDREAIKNSSADAALALVLEVFP
ncbi:MAG: CinA family protein [Anaerolineae bacterium]